MEKEILELPRENNTMLKRVCDWLDKAESNQYRNSEDMKQFVMNCVANIMTSPRQTCDIPYFQTREYRHNKDAFDHETFYTWAEAQTQPVFVCEYWCPPERFFCIAEFDRVSTFSATNNSMRVKERVLCRTNGRNGGKGTESPSLPCKKTLFDDI